MSNRNLVLMVALVCAVGGLLWANQRREIERLVRVMEKLEQRPAPQAPPAIVHTNDPVSAAELADQVAARLKPNPPEKEAATPASVAPPEYARAHQSVEDRLGAAFARGKWNSDDLNELRKEMPHLGVEENGALMQRIAVAVNTGKLVPADLHSIYP